MPGLVPGIHVFCARARKTWMAGTSSAKTRFALLPGHDEKENHFQVVRKSPKRWMHFRSGSEERRLRRVSKDETFSTSWFETTQERLLTMRIDFHATAPDARNCRIDASS